MEKEELQGSLEESESFGGRGDQVLRLQLEVSQVKGEMERRLKEGGEKWKLLEKATRGHLRPCRPVWTWRSKANRGAEAEEETGGGHQRAGAAGGAAHQEHAELSKSSKKMQQQIKELQAQLEEEVRSHEECKEDQRAWNACMLLVSQSEETLASLESAERARRVSETKLQEANEKHSHLNNQFQLAVSGKEAGGDLQTLQQEHEEMHADLRASTDKSKKASCELERVGEELRLEQERTVQLERVKKGLEAQVKELELELDSEKRHTETVKTLRKNERRLKELLFESEEEQKNQQRMQELVERLQTR
ncbi:hypothetical protein FQN60_011496 [Etheostoma spectabile]|uniref:Myosin tail domain-containing protein n=1 Tax=Etheostoma spectabile TaxID=54343 RepID=A0A5J5CAL8_9PERO|nr:hypothetical protein FQN60_011496 [Etheostoma spectabile]